jgi:cytochrome c-type biogenesis protein CcsB
MINVVLFVLAGVAYLGATFLYHAAWFGTLRRFRRMATTLLISAVAVHGLAIVARWLESGRPPMSNLFEALSLYAWALALLYVILERRIGYPELGALVTPLALIAIVAASVLPKGIVPLIPVLQSHWLGVHVTISFLAYAAFTIGFAVAVAFLRLDHSLKKRRNLGWRWDLPPLATLERLGQRFAVIGLFLMTGSLISGSLWAEHAWGVPWVWQPQQVGALVTWLVYVLYMVFWKWRGWAGRRLSWVLVAGFGAMLVTFVGVDLLPGNLHSFLFT